MKKIVKFHRTTPTEDVLFYTVFYEDHYFGIEILQFHQNKLETCRKIPGLFRRRLPAIRFAKKLRDYAVYPVHLEEILSDHNLL